MRGGALMIGAMCLVGFGVCVGGAQGQCEEVWDDRFSLPDIDGVVECAVWHDDGSGMKLYINGQFTQVAGVPAAGLARWDGTSWESVPGGLTDRDDYSRIELVSGGPGQPLYAIGWDKQLNGQSTDGILAWDGSAWSPVWSEDYAHALTPGPPSNPGRLTLVSRETYHDREIRQWDGAAWNSIASGPDVFWVREMLWIDTGSGPQLIAFGEEMEFAGEGVAYAAAWDGQSWSGLGDGPPGSIRNPIVFDDGTGPALYCVCYPWDSRGLYRWNGEAWEWLYDSGDTNQPGNLRVVDDGHGPSLYAMMFDRTHGLVVHRWDGQAFVPVPGTPDGSCMFTSNMPETGLVAFGDFLAIDDQPMVRVAAWDGLEWSALGSRSFGRGVPRAQQLTAAYDTGNLALDGMIFVSGEPRIGIPQNDLVTAWDGTSWQELGLVADEPGYNLLTSMLIADLGSGTRLLAGGYFSTDEGSITSLAQWDGLVWS